MVEIANDHHSHVSSPFGSMVVGCTFSRPYD